MRATGIPVAVQILHDNYIHMQHQREMNNSVLAAIHNSNVQSRPQDLPATINDMKLLLAEALSGIILQQQHQVLSNVSPVLSTQPLLVGPNGRSDSAAVEYAVYHWAGRMRPFPKSWRFPKQ